MTHIILNTGHTSKQLNSDIRHDFIRALRVLLPRGGNLGQFAASMAAFTVQIAQVPGGAIFTVFGGREPVVVCAVAWLRAVAPVVWGEIELTYLRLSDGGTGAALSATAAPEIPETIPWFATVLLRPMVNLTHSEIVWLGDFERCLAFTLIEADRSSPR